jgi:O-antigen ligase
LIVPLLRGANLDQSSLNSIEKSIEYFCWLNVVIVILNFSFPSIPFFGESYTTEGGSRAFGWMGDQIALIFSFFISIFLAKEKYIKAAIVFIALLATGSIGATVIALVVGIVLLLPYFKRKMKSKNSQFSLLFLSVAFFIVFYFYVIPNATVFSRLSIENVDPSEEKGVGFHRFIAFQTAADSWSENKFIGCGFGTYSTIMHKKYSYLEDDYDSSLSVTSMVNTFNQYLQFLVEIGLLGLIMAIIFFRGVIKEISSKVEQTKSDFARGFKIWGVILLVFNQTAVWFLPGSLILLMFFLGVALSLSNKIVVANFK